MGYTYGYDWPLVMELGIYMGGFQNTLKPKPKIVDLPGAGQITKTSPGLNPNGGCPNYGAPFWGSP